MEKVIALALDMAKKAFELGETPVGAVVFDTKTKRIISSAHNLTESQNDSTAHAEILAIRDAEKALGVSNLSGYSLFATVEPCAMCAGAIAWAKLDKLYFGAYDTKSGAVENGVHFFESSTCHHKPEIVGGLHEADCSALMTDFFKEKR